MVEAKSKISSFRYKTTDPNDNNYAETVYRLIMTGSGQDAQVKEQYQQFCDQLYIDVEEIRDQKLDDFKEQGKGSHIAQLRFDVHKDKRRQKLIQLGDFIKYQSSRQPPRTSQNNASPQPSMGLGAFQSAMTLNQQSTLPHIRQATRTTSVVSVIGNNASPQNAGAFMTMLPDNVPLTTKSAAKPQRTTLAAINPNPVSTLAKEDNYGMTVPRSVDFSARVNRQVQNWERYEDMNSQKAARLDNLISKKQKNFDKWSKEKRTEIKDLQEEALANRVIFNQRKKLIQDKIHEEEVDAVDSYKKELKELAERKQKQELKLKQASERQRMQFKEAHAMRQKKRSLENGSPISNNYMNEASLNETQESIIHNIGEFEKAVTDLNSLFDRLKTNKLRHENQLRFKVQQAKNMTSQVIDKKQRHEMFKQEKFENDTIELHKSIEKKMKSVRKYEKQLKEQKDEKHEYNLGQVAKSEACHKYIKEQHDEMKYKLDMKNEKKAKHLESVHRREQVQKAELVSEFHKLKQQDAQRRQEIMKHMDLMQKQNIVMKHQRIEQQANALRQNKEELRQMYRLGDQMRIQKLEERVDKRLSPMRSPSPTKLASPRKV